MNYEQVIKLNEDIEEMVYQSDISYIDAIITYCQEMNMEFEVVVAQLSGMIHENVRREAIELKMLKKDELINELPV